MREKVEEMQPILIYWCKTIGIIVKIFIDNEWKRSDINYSVQTLNWYLNFVKFLTGDVHSHLSEIGYTHFNIVISAPNLIDARKVISTTSFQHLMLYTSAFENCVNTIFNFVYMRCFDNNDIKVVRALKLKNKQRNPLSLKRICAAQLINFNIQIPTNMKY